MTKSSRKDRRGAVVWHAVMGLLLGLLLPPLAAASSAYLLEVEGAIGPAVSDYVERSLRKAEADPGGFVVLRLDTPGGLDTSMRSIIKEIVASSVPVATFVAPGGARAASAGTYILYASHIAAMAPGTNLGAATPVQLGGLPQADEPAKEDGEQGEAHKEGGSGGELKGGTLARKATNDAVAYIRGLARMRGRNADWAELAVREAASIPAEEALELGVIDLLARDVDELLQKANGRKVVVQGQERILDTASLTQVRLVPDWRTRLLEVISNPNIAYVLMLIGIYGLIYEFSNPGTAVPGIAGGICLLLALYAFHLLPINYAGAALLLVGLALMVAEAFVPSFGALGIGGVVSFVIGSVILMDTDAPGYGIALPLVLSLAIFSALAIILTVSFAIRVRSRPVVSGAEELIGAEGRAINGVSVRVHGEVWGARSDGSLHPGEPVRVIAREGLTLVVTPEKTKG